MNLPDNLRYTKEHEWVRVEDDGKTVTIGITDFAQGELGDVVFVELEPEGSSFSKDEVFGSVEAVKTVSELFMPVSGTIVELNEELDATPESVNTDPYGAGWMVRIEVSEPDELEALLSGSEYAAMIGA